MEKKKILYLSADYGAGHKNAVEALKQSLDTQYPGVFEHQIIDVAALLGTSIDKIAELMFKYSVMYAKLSWKAFFEITDRTGAVDSDRRVYKILKPGLKPIVDANPDLIIACYPLIAYSVSQYLKDKGVDVPFISLVTDTGQVHINWVSDRIDYYLVPTEDTGFYLTERGIDKEKILALGFPVKQNFYRRYSREKAREKYQISKDNNCVVYFSGAWGVGKVKDKLIALDEELDDTTILVVCGRNDKLVKSLSKVKYKNDIRPLGFVDDMAEIFAAADLVVSKAGGISVMELITAKKPVVITEVTPGQEEPNARFIEMMGFGYVEKKPDELAKRVKFIFEYNDLDRLKRNLENYHLNEKSDKEISRFIHEITKKGNDETSLNYFQRLFRGK